MQNPEEEIKISSSLDRILQQKHRLKNYSEIHYERIRQRSLERDFINFPSNPYYRQREEYVQQNHKNLFMRPIDFYYKSNLYFNYQPSPPLAEKVLNYKTIFNEGSEEVNNQSKSRATKLLKLITNYFVQKETNYTLIVRKNQSQNSQGLQIIKILSKRKREKLLSLKANNLQFSQAAKHTIQKN